jgi:phage FluMu protein Com
MNEAQKPTYYSEIECPVCQTLNKFVSIKAESLTANANDKNERAGSNTWAGHGNQEIDPLLFFMATCSNCFYTRRLNSEYRDWKDNPGFNKKFEDNNIRRNHLASLSNKDSVVIFLGNHIEHSKYPYETAVIKLLLGIYDEMISDEPSAIEMGRFFLRVAWLFRDHEHKCQDYDIRTDGFFTRLLDTVSATNRLLPAYDTHMKSLKKLIENEYPARIAENANNGEERPSIEKFISEINSGLASLAEAGSRLMNAFEDVDRALMGMAGACDKSFYSYPDFAAFLAAAREKWPEIPLNEKEALTRATEYYLKAAEASDQSRRDDHPIDEEDSTEDSPTETDGISSSDRSPADLTGHRGELVIKRRADDSSADNEQSQVESESVQVGAAQD